MAIEVPPTRRPLAVSRQPEDLPRPVDHLPLDIDRGVLAAAEIGVERARQELGERAGRRAGAVDPAHEARMGVAVGIGQHELGEAPVDLGRIRRLRGGPAVRRLDRLGTGRQTGRSRTPAHQSTMSSTAAWQSGAESPPVLRVQRPAHAPARTRAAS